MRILSFVSLFFFYSGGITAQFTVESKNFDFAISERVEGVAVSNERRAVYLNTYKDGVQPVLLEVRRDPVDLIPLAAMEPMKLGENSSVPISIDKVGLGNNGEIFYTATKVASLGSGFQHSHFLMKSDASSPSINELVEIMADEKSKKYFYNKELISDKRGGVYWIGNTYLKSNPTGQVNNDIILISFDDKGKILWQQEYDGGRYDEVNSTIVTSQRGILICGKLNGKRGLISYNSNGALAWTYQPKNYVSATKMMESDKGSIILCGEGGPNSSRKNGNVYIEKVDGNGKLIWSAEYDNPSSTSDDIADLLVQEDGSSYLLVYSKLKKGYSLNLVKFDSYGKFVHEQQVLILKKVPKTYAGIKNLSFLRQIGEKVGVFSQSNLKEKAGLFVGILDEHLDLMYQHTLPRNGSASLNPVEVFDFDDGSFFVVAKDASSFRGKNKLNVHYFRKD